MKPYPLHLIAEVVRVVFEGSDLALTGVAAVLTSDDLKKGPGRVWCVEDKGEE